MPEVVDVLDVIASAYESQERRMESQLKYSLGLLEMESERAWDVEKASRENFVFALDRAEGEIKETQKQLAASWIGRMEMIAGESFSGWQAAVANDPENNALSQYKETLQSQLGPQEGAVVYKMIEDYYNPNEEVRANAMNQALEHASDLKANYDQYQASVALRMIDNEAISEKNQGIIESNQRIAEDAGLDLGEAMEQGIKGIQPTEELYPILPIGGIFKKYQEAGALGEYTMINDEWKFDQGKHDRVMQTLDFIGQSFEYEANISREYQEMVNERDYKIQTDVTFPSSNIVLPAEPPPAAVEFAGYDFLGTTSMEASEVRDDAFRKKEAVLNELDTLIGYRNQGYQVDESKITRKEAELAEAEKVYEDRNLEYRETVRKAEEESAVLELQNLGVDLTPQNIARKKEELDIAAEKEHALQMERAKTEGGLYRWDSTQPTRRE